MQNVLGWLLRELSGRWSCGHLRNDAVNPVVNPEDLDAGWEGEVEIVPLSGARGTRTTDPPTSATEAGETGDADARKEPLLIMCPPMGS